MADTNSDRTAYKHLQEQFVSGHSGTTLLEIALVVSIAPASVLLRNVGVNCFKQSGHELTGVSKFILDFVLLMMPVFLCSTLLQDSIDKTLLWMTLTSIVIVMIVYLYNNYALRKHRRFRLKYILDIAVYGKRPFITDFRAYVNIATAICILAVDFTIYPRRFAKAETYGSGLMDAGVGGFMISNAIVCPEARGKTQQQRGLMGRLGGILKAVRSTLPLWVLGICRLAAVKSVDYQEHVSEYGVHWNFFFSLAVVKILASVIMCVFHPSMSWLIAIAVASGYQYMLSGLNWKHFVLHGSDGQGSRNGIIEANREGIFSSLGYLAIFFAGIQIGNYLWQPRSKLRDWISCFLVLFVTDAFFWVLLSYSEEHVEPISRRMANLSYVLWMLAYNLHLISCFLLVDIAGIILENTVFVYKVQKNVKQKSMHGFCLLDAINKNGLFYFLFANILTGFVNMSMSTINASPTTGFLVMTGYMLGLSLVIALLSYKNISLKFW